MGQIKGGITGILGIMENEKASKIYQNQKYHKNPTTHDAKSYFVPYMPVIVAARSIKLFGMVDGNLYQKNA